MLYDRPVEGSRFQFSIRSLLLLTLAVAIPCSWLAVEIKAAKKQRETVEAIEQLDGRVYYLQERSEPAWLQSPLGKDFFANIGTVELSSAHITDIELGRLNLKGLNQLEGLYLTDSKLTDAGLQYLEGLPQLQALALGGQSQTQITDAGLEHLMGMNQLQQLSLNHCQITDAGLERLKGMSRLQDLSLGETQVTDIGLEHLEALDHLPVLDLASTRVTDDGLEHLKRLSRLRYLHLNGTHVTDVGVKKLQRELPTCLIYAH